MIFHFYIAISVKYIHVIYLLIVLILLSTHYASIKSINKTWLFYISKLKLFEIIYNSVKADVWLYKCMRDQKN